MNHFLNMPQIHIILCYCPHPTPTSNSLPPPSSLNLSSAKPSNSCQLRRPPSCLPACPPRWQRRRPHISISASFSSVSERATDDPLSAHQFVEVQGEVTRRGAAGWGRGGRHCGGWARTEEEEESRRGGEPLSLSLRNPIMPLAASGLAIYGGSEF